MNWKVIFFKEYNDWVPYQNESVCECVEEACLKKVYNQLNPGIEADHDYKIEFKDGEIVHILFGVIVSGKIKFTNKFANELESK